MTQEEILEGNKLIAEFVGFKNHDSDTIETDNEIFMIPTDVKNGEVNSLGYLYSYNELLFNRDWNWLMAVVNKIETIEFNIWGKLSMSVNRVYIQEFWGVEGIKGYGQSKTKIEATYKAVIEFIKWYNRNDMKK
jgi:hypothetical protein